jgi:AcrR family transcriptional regulator
MASSSSSPRRRRPPRSDTRAKVLAAAARVFAERGFAGASLDDVAAAAGLTKGAIYSSFASKEELVLTLMEDHVQQRISAAADAFNRSRDTAAGARQIGAQLIDATRADPAWHRLFLEYWVHAMRDPQQREHLLERRRDLRRMIAAAIRQASKDHDLTLSRPADQLAVALLALSNGLAIEGLLDPDAVPARLFSQLVESLLGN